MPFKNPIAGTLGTLVREALQSLGFVSGSTGWRIARDGTAEFSNGVFRGSVQAGPPAAGHVIIDAAGIRVYGSTGALYLNIESNGGPGNDGTITTFDTVGNTSFMQNGDAICSDLITQVPGSGLPITFFDIDNPFNPVKMNNGIGNGLGLPGGILAIATSTAGTTPGAGPTKDGGCGDITFTSYAGRNYAFAYHARGGNVTAGDHLTVTIRDGGASSPTSASTARAAAGVAFAGASSTTDVFVYQSWVDGVNTLPAGTHTVAAFYQRTSGSGNVAMSQETGQFRELAVYDMG